jgi:hypothetical protein
MDETCHLTRLHRINTGVAAIVAGMVLKTGCSCVRRYSTLMLKIYETM